MEASSSKKLKTDDDAVQGFISRIKETRAKAGNPAEFKFDKTRCRMLSTELNFPEEHNGVVYWMSRDQRVQDNWALIYAQRLAMAEKKPLAVCFCLVPKFLEATIRQYGFMLKGLREVRRELNKLRIPFFLLLGEAPKVLPEFVSKHKIGGLVTDFAPLRVPMDWVNKVAKKIPQDIPFCQVDAHNIVPLWVTSGKQEHAARTIRPKITKALPQYLTEYPEVIKHPYPDKALLESAKDPFENYDRLIEFLEVDHSIPEVDWAQGGTTAGLQTLHSFIQERLRIFDQKRNDPNAAALSNMSPWFKFGQVSVARSVLEVKKSAHKDSVAAFVEEAVVRRELSDNFCYYNENYDNLAGALNWARQTLVDHKKDKRGKLFTVKELEEARTHEDLWNAAQVQMVVEGKLHGFMRMYWAKKILEWTESPEKALEIAIALNDKYNIDGRDPNGYVGCMWSICGIHDQGWREREVFGKIRYMNLEGCKRKFDINAYIAKYRRVARDCGMKVMKNAFTNATGNSVASGSYSSSAATIASKKPKPKK